MFKNIHSVQYYTSSNTDFRFKTPYEKNLISSNTTFKLDYRPEKHSFIIKVIAFIELQALNFK